MIVSPEDKDKPSGLSRAGTGLPLSRARLNAQSVATVGLLRGDDSVAGPDSPEESRGESPPTDRARASTPAPNKSGPNDD